MRASGLIAILTATCGFAIAACGGDSFEDGGTTDSVAGAGGAGANQGGGGGAAGKAGAGQGGYAAGAAGFSGTPTAGTAGAAAGGAAGTSGAGGSGGATQACKPGTYACNGDELRGCAADGSQEVSVQTCLPGLCSAAQGACLVCQPNAPVGCSSPTALSVCSPTGMMKTPAPCPVNKPHCNAGECLECVDETQCPEPSDIEYCAVRACIKGACGIIPVAAGPASKQKPQDCRNIVCDSTGSWSEVPDPADLPASDNNDCTLEICDGMTPVHKPVEVGAPCGPDKTGFCTASSTCGKCLPGSARCNNGLHETCSALGQWEANPCSKETICSGGDCTSVIRIAAGDAHTCAVLKNGRVSCWGSNEFGQLGTGDSGSGKKELRPQVVGGLDDAVDIALGNRHTCALLKSGDVMCWGANDLGQVGGGSQADAIIPSPQPVAGLTKIALLALGADASCAADADGNVYCWGNRQHGQIGDGTSAAPTQPTPSKVSGTCAVSLSSRGLFTCTTCINNPSCWGEGFNGQSGSSAMSSLTPVVYPGTTDVASVVVGAHHGCLTMLAGDVRCWGDNSLGQVGVGELSPWQSLGSTKFTIGAGPMALGNNHTCQAVADGVQCAGSDDQGQVGDGLFHPSASTPMKVKTSNGVTPTYLPAATQLAAGGDHTCALDTKGVVRCWGAGDSGQLGNGAAVAQSVATVVLW